MYHAGRCQIGRTISLMDNKRSSWRIIKGTQQHRVFKILGVRKPIFSTCHCFEVSTSATCAHVQIAEPKANVAEDSLPLEHLESTPQRSSGHSQAILKTSEDRSRSEAPLYLFSAVQASIQRNSGPLRSKMQNEFFQFGPHPRHDEGPGRLFLNSRCGTNTVLPSISKWNLQLVVLCFVKPAVHEAIGSNIAGR